MKYALNAKLGVGDAAVDTTKEAIMALKQPLQLREIACYVLATHGVGKELDQAALFEELDSHQSDNKVLSRTPAQPISRVMAFYRGRVDEIGLFTTTKTPKEPKAPKAPKTDADGNPIAKEAKAPKKSKRKVLEEATEAGAAEASTEVAFSGADEAASQVM